jgi:tetratricopeptide (TPR) repeat protein
MVVAGRQLAAAGAILLFWLAPALAGEPPPTVPTTTLPIVDDDDGVPVIEISLNGRGPYRASVDTGAQGVEIESDLAKQLGLQATRRNQFPGLAGPAQGVSRGGQVSIAFGPVKVDHIGTAISDTDPASARFRKQIHINIGTNLFEGFALTIDLPGRKIVLTPSDSYVAPAGGVLLPMEKGHSLELIPASVDGEGGWYCIDTGANYGVWFAQDFVQDHDLTTRFRWPASVGHMTVFGATRRLDSQSRYGLRLGAALFLEPRVTFPEYLAAGDTAMPGAGCIGMRVLGYFRFTLDKSRRQFVVEPASSETRLLSGPGVDFGAGQPLIRSVAAGGPADAAGLKPGDELLALDGKSAAEALRNLDGAAWFAHRHGRWARAEIRRDGQVVVADLSVHHWSSPALQLPGSDAPSCAAPPCHPELPQAPGASSSGGHSVGMIGTYTSALQNRLLPMTDRAMTLVARGFEWLALDETECCRIAFGQFFRGDRYELLDHHACETAIQDFDAARHADPGGRYSLIGRADCLVRLGRYDEALADYTTALAMRADAGSVLAARGWAYRRAGRQVQALADFDAALAGHDPTVRTRQGRAETLLLLGQLGAASIAFDEVLRLAPNDIDGTIWRYLAMKRGGASEAALAIDLDVRAKGSWPYQFLRLFKDEISPAELMAEAAASDPRLARDRQCEVNFYVGEYFLTKADRTAARDFFTHATNGCDRSRVERPDAKSELQLLAADKP